MNAEQEPPSSVPVANAEDDLHCPVCGYNLTGLPLDRCPECGLEGAAKRAARERQRQRYRPYKRVCLAVIAVVFLASGVLEGLAPQQNTSALLVGLVVAAASFAWCHCDAALHGGAISQRMALAVFFVPPLGVTIYLLSRRRWRSFAKALGFVVLTTMSSAAASLVAFYLRYGYW